MKTPPRPLTISQRIGIALASFAGITLIAGWSLTGGGATERRADLAIRSPDTRLSPALATPVTTAPATGDSIEAPSPASSALSTAKPRAKVSCAECGVIVAVLRIDTPVPVMAGCYASDGPAFHGRLISAGGLYDTDSLADTVASVVADGRGRKKVTIDTRHQIVVRLRDGSKQVFDEATPRNLHVGDRMVIIAGTEQTKALAANRSRSMANVWSSVRSRTDG